MKPTVLTTILYIFQDEEKPSNSAKLIHKHLFVQ